MHLQLDKGATKTLCMMSHRVPLNGAMPGMIWMRVGHLSDAHNVSACQQA
jgi:hypothetical protein